MSVHRNSTAARSRAQAGRSLSATSRRTAARINAAVSLERTVARCARELSTKTLTELLKAFLVQLGGDS